jgi:hypothetical protein
LDPQELLYLTVGYDWLLFRHQVIDRRVRGEDIFYFCFYFLDYVMDEEFTIERISRLTLGGRLGEEQLPVLPSSVPRQITTLEGSSSSCSASSSASSASSSSSGSSPLASQAKSFYSTALDTTAFEKAESYFRDRADSFTEIGCTPVEARATPIAIPSRNRSDSESQVPLVSYSSLLALRILFHSHLSSLRTVPTVGKWSSVFLL